MKYFFIFFSIAAFILSVGGCESALNIADSERGDSDKIKIVATIFPLYDFAYSIAGDRADISMLLPPSSDSHLYEPSPRDIIKIKEADIFLYIGGASDEWSESVFSDEDLFLPVRLMDSVDPLENEHVHEDSYFDEYDEHIWTSPVNAVLIVQTICEALSAADPENANFYRDNADDYIARLNDLDALFRKVASDAPKNTIVFADRFAFRYLAEEYGFEYFAALPTCAEHTEPSAQTLVFLIEKIKEEELPVVFYGELSDMRTANSISRETGAVPMLLHSCHTLSREMLNTGAGYIEIMQENAEALKTALN
ncbi:MAG: metal ABC transporter substrate-binding protein [Oscillospiraceae bacterium]|nr:metal ABC transporter substrate-binding protein [Oscillospiraceae bacterium]